MNYSNGHVYLKVDQRDQVCDTNDLKLFAAPKLEVSWTNLTFDIKRKPPIVSVERWMPNFIRKSPSSYRHRILQPQNGRICGGSLTAIMGPSGAGKSTLLNCITGWNEKGVGGAINVTCSKDKKRINVSLVPQTDLLLGHFTIEETLMFASKIKNVSGTDHEKKVQQVLTSLNLSDYSSNKVSKCSGGQKKRISIGIELISSPDVLILDEPTSGLDSVNAETCMKLLVKLAADSMTAIVVTIHQPNYLIFSLFANIYLLSKKGSLIYFGPPAQIGNHFAKFNLSIPATASPGDFAIEIASRSDRELLFDQMSDYYRSKELEAVTAFTQNNGETNNNNGCGNGTKSENMKVLPVRKVIARNSNEVSSWYQLYLLSLRSLQVSCIRSPRLVTKMIINMIVIVILADVYAINPGIEDGCLLQNKSNKTIRDALYEDFLNVKNNSSERNLKRFDERIPDIINGVNFQYACILYLLLVYSIGAVLVTPLEIMTTLKEIRNSWYSVSVYMISKTIAELPSLFVSVIVAISVAYYLTEQIWVLWRFLQFALLMVIFSWVCESYGMLIGIVIKDMISATLVTMALTLPILIYSGFLIKIEHMSWYHRIVSYVSFARFAFEGALLTIFGYNRCEPIPRGVDLELIKDDIKKQELEDVITTILRSLGLTQKTVYNFGNIIDVDRPCFSSVVNNSLEFFGLFDETPSLNLLAMSEEPDPKYLSADSSYVLNFFQIRESMFWPNCLILLGMGFLFRAVSLVAIYSRKRQNDR